MGRMGERNLATAINLMKIFGVICMENDFGQIINYISGGKGGIGREGFFVTRACACARVQCLVYFSSYVSKIIFTRSEDFSRVSCLRVMPHIRRGGSRARNVMIQGNEAVWDHYTCQRSYNLIRPFQGSISFLRPSLIISYVSLFKPFYRGELLFQEQERYATGLRFRLLFVSSFLSDNKWAHAGATTVRSIYFV